MKKRSKIPAKLLAILLAVCLLASTVAPAFAADRDGSTRYTAGKEVNGTNEDGSKKWNSAGGDQYLLADNFDVTITFENEPFISNNDNWSNFVFELFGGDNTKGLTLRADAFAWTYDWAGSEASYNNADPTWAVTEKTWGDNWEGSGGFQEICKNNPIVTLNLKKTSGTVVTVTINFYPKLRSSTPAATEVYTITYGDGVPSSMRVQVGSEGGKVKILECKYNTAEVTRTDLDITGFLGDKTPDDVVSGDFSLVYTFHNKTKNTASQWFNFIVEVYDKRPAENGTFGITVRADAYGWGFNDTVPGLTWDTNGANWDVFRQDMADADVTVTVNRVGKVITFIYDIVASTGHTYHIVGQTAELDILPQDLKVYLSGENVELTDIKVTIYDLVYTGDDGTGPTRVSVHDPSVVKDPATGT